MAGKNTENTGSENTDPPAGGSSDPPEGAPAGTPSTGDMLSMSSDQLKDRLTRAQLSYLQEQFGTKDSAEIKAKLQQLDDMREAEEQRKREQLSKEEQLQADLDAERARSQAAQEERDAVAFENHITRLCAELGVKNVDFAMWEVARKADDMPEGEQFDAKEYLQGLLEIDQSRAALGAPAPVETEPTPATTSPAGAPGTEPDPNGGTPKTGEDAFGLNKDDWMAKKARLGIQ